MTVTKGDNTNNYNFDLLKDKGYAIPPTDSTKWLSTPPRVDIAIKGQIKDKDGKPISDANVKFIPDKPNPNVTIPPVKTDANGNFEIKFSGFKGDTYPGKIDIEKPKYAPLVIPNVNLSPGNGYTVAVPPSSTVVAYIPQSKTGVLSGQLIDSKTNKPIEGASVNLTLNPAA